MPVSSNTVNHVQSNNMAELFAGDYMQNSVTKVIMALPGLKLLMIQYVVKAVSQLQRQQQQKLLCLLQN